MVPNVLTDAMMWYIRENPGTTVMGLRDGLREWRVNDQVYCFETIDGRRAFCIQDVSWDFYTSVRFLCATGHVRVFDGLSTAIKTDPYLYHDIAGLAQYVPLRLFSHVVTNRC